MAGDSFSDSVLENADLAFDTIQRSLENEKESLEVLFHACRDFLQLHHRNKKKANDQYSFHQRSKTRKSEFNNRKRAAIRRYHPTGTDAFQALVKEYLDIKETQDESSGKMRSQSSCYFRYLKKIFDNSSFEKGAFGPLTGFYGILLTNPPYFITELSAVYHGICSISEKNNRNYRDEAYFAKEIENKGFELYERFSPLQVFEEQSLTESTKHQMAKSLRTRSSQWFKIRPSDSEQLEFAQRSLRLLSPWGVAAPAIENLNTRNLRLNKIKEFFFRGENPMMEIAEVRKRIAAVMDFSFFRALVDNETIRINSMSTELHLPVIKNQTTERDSLVWTQIDKLGDNVKLVIAENALRDQKIRASLETFDLSIEIDGVESLCFSAQASQGVTVDIPQNAKIINVRAKLSETIGTIESVPLATLLIRTTNLSEGESWYSESNLENGFHIALNVEPSRGSLPFQLSVDYHHSNDCEQTFTSGEQVSAFLSKFVAALRNQNFLLTDRSANVLLFACVLSAIFLIYNMLANPTPTDLGVFESFYIPIALLICAGLLVISVVKMEFYNRIYTFQIQFSGSFVLRSCVAVFVVVIALFQMVYITKVNALNSELALNNERQKNISYRQKVLDQRAIETEARGHFAINSGGPGDGLYREFVESEEEAGELELRLKRIEQISDPQFLPTTWALIGKINNEFGFRRNPFGGRTYEFHPGMDIEGERGDHVLAPGNGTVVTAGWAGGYGNMIEIDHGNGLTTRYGHLAKIEVGVGDSVSRGQLIGLVGSTGRSTGPHLHYELRLEDKVINPRRFLPTASPVLESSDPEK